MAAMKWKQQATQMALLLLVGLICCQLASVEGLCRLRGRPMSRSSRDCPLIKGAKQLMSGGGLKIAPTIVNQIYVDRGARNHQGDQLDGQAQFSAHYYDQGRSQADGSEQAAARLNANLALGGQGGRASQNQASSHLNLGFNFNSNLNPNSQMDANLNGGHQGGGHLGAHHGGGNMGGGFSGHLGGGVGAGRQHQGEGHLGVEMGGGVGHGAMQVNSGGAQMGGHLGGGVGGLKGGHLDVELGAGRGGMHSGDVHGSAQAGAGATLGLGGHLGGHAVGDGVHGDFRAAMPGARVGVHLGANNQNGNGFQGDHMNVRTNRGPEGAISGTIRSSMGNGYNGMQDNSYGGRQLPVGMNNQGRSSFNNPPGVGFSAQGGADYKNPNMNVNHMANSPNQGNNHGSASDQHKSTTGYLPSSYPSSYPSSKLSSSYMLSGRYGASSNSNTNNNAYNGQMANSAAMHASVAPQNKGAEQMHGQSQPKSNMQAYPNSYNQAQGYPNINMHGQMGRNKPSQMVNSNQFEVARMPGGGMSAQNGMNSVVNHRRQQYPASRLDGRQQYGGPNASVAFGGQHKQQQQQQMQPARNNYVNYYQDTHERKPNYGAANGAVPNHNQQMHYDQRLKDNNSNYNQQKYEKESDHQHHHHHNGQAHGHGFSLQGDLSLNFERHNDGRRHRGSKLIGALKQLKSAHDARRGDRCNQANACYNQATSGLVGNLVSSVAQRQGSGRGTSKRDVVALALKGLNGRI